jgi:hypothetical protein
MACGGAAAVFERITEGETGHLFAFFPCAWKGVDFNL